MRIGKFVFAAFSAASPNPNQPIQDERPYLMLYEPTLSAVSISFLSPSWNPTPVPRGLSSRPRFRPAWLCSFRFWDSSTFLFSPLEARFHFSSSSHIRVLASAAISTFRFLGESLLPHSLLL